jgi:putative transposase
VTDSIVKDESGEQPVQAPQGAASEEQLIAMLMGRARTQVLRLTGEGGLLQQLTKRVLESALEGEITDHVGYDKHDAAGRGGGNSRNGTRAKTVLTDVGPGRGQGAQGHRRHLRATDRPQAAAPFDRR